jgi:hypothetical protein
LLTGPVRPTVPLPAADRRWRSRNSQQETRDYGPRYVNRNVPLPSFWGRYIRGCFPVSSHREAPVRCSGAPALVNLGPATEAGQLARNYVPRPSFPGRCTHCRKAKKVGTRCPMSGFIQFTASPVTWKGSARLQRGSQAWQAVPPKESWTCQVNSRWILGDGIVERLLQLVNSRRHAACNFPKVWKDTKLCSSAYSLGLEIGSTASPANSAIKGHVDFDRLHHISTCKVMRRSTDRRTSPLLLVQPSPFRSA